MTRTAAIIGLARYRARQTIIEQWRAQGHKLSELSAAEVRERADIYLAFHPQLYDVAAEAIDRNPRLWGIRPHVKYQNK
jgi:hypothetical protein